MKLALWQGNSPASDIAKALAEAEAALDAAGRLGTDCLVLPELWLPGYNQPSIAEMALTQGAPELRALANMCKAANCGLVIGYAENAGGICYNSALALDRQGNQIAHYRKVQLYGAREKALFRAGDAYTTFDLNGTKAAILICYDVEFSHHVAEMAAAGVKVLLVPTANMVPFDHVVRHTVPTMSANHGLTIVYANYCGVEGDLTYLGGSLITGPHGEVMAQAGTQPALLITEIPVVDPTRLSTQAQDIRRI